MAQSKSQKRSSRAKKPAKAKASRWSFRFLLRLLFRVVVAVALIWVLWTVSYRWIDPPTTPYILAEEGRLGQVAHRWVDLDDVAPVMARAVVAAEDANFCNHWGFDVEAIRDAIEDGGTRGASTLSQQVVKNAVLWQGRSWLRKAMEASLTPVMEAAWPKRRIVEVYLNVAEFGEGTFGVHAAARRYFDTDPERLSDAQAAALAAVLPSPKTRNPAEPTDFLRRRIAAIRDGAATIDRDGRADCFQG